LYFIPTTQDLAISFTVKAYQDGQEFASKNHTYTISSQAMQAGMSYNLTADFNANSVEGDYPIVFTAVVSGWNDFSEVTIP
jgi:hypothetical protein